MASTLLHLISLLLISCLLAKCHGATFSSLQKTLILTASPKNGQVLKAGEDSVTVTWSFNNSFQGRIDSAYNSVQVKLCYAPISQLDRAWRKTYDDLVKDKTCQHTIVSRPYNPSSNNFTWIVERDVPTGTYFVRAYAYNGAKEEVAYGQTTDAHKTTNLFKVEAISGRHVSLDIASICFSGFAVVSLFGFFLLEKRRTRIAQKN